MTGAGDIFQRVICGANGSDESADAVEVAARVAAADGSLVVVTVDDPSIAVHAGWAMSRVAEQLAQEAQAASLLVARSPVALEDWPRTIVVGVDGSDGSALALAAARELAAQRGSEVRSLLATREANVDVEAARALAPDLEERDEQVLDVLHSASEEADLVVVGSRGLRGLRALGSVGERIAHEALCSVLVVRGAVG